MIDLGSDNPLTVVHSVQIWLSQTMTWLHTEVASLPSRIRNHVVCDVSDNLDQFPISNLISADQDTRVWKFLSAQSWQIAKRRRSHLLVDCTRRNGARILHSHFGDRGWGNLPAAARTDLKHVVTFYGYDASRLPQLEPIWRDRYLEMFASADLFLCEGPHLGNTLVELGCPPEKVKVQHLGLDLDRIPFQPRRWRPDTPLRVLIAGSFMEKKGIPYAIEALGRIKESVELEITVIGDANHQERSKREKHLILETVTRCGLQSRVRLRGYQPYAVLLEEAHRHHIFLSPSVTASDGDTEGGAPVAVIEMAASGMPVVSSRHCDIPEVIADGDTGLLAEERNVTELSNKLMWLIENPDSWGSMVTSARRHIEAEFDAATQGQRLASLYDSLLTEVGA